MSFRRPAVCTVFVSAVLLAGCGGAAPTAILAPTAIAVPPLDGRAGGVIAFYSEASGNADIFLMNGDGTAQTRLTDNSAHDTCPAWSPDGTQIAFASDRDDPNPVRCFPNCNENLYVMNADGSDQRRLTEHPAAEVHPAWSPDGTRITFDSDRDGDGKGEIYVINADGTGERQVTDGATDDRWADWSPDGTWIAFSSKRGADYEIFAMSPDGSGLQQLTDNDLDDLFPAWSPDGRQIAFFALKIGSTKQDLYVMNADGTDVQQLTDTPYGVDEDPAWSPDGTRIAFQTDRDGNFEIYSMKADGSDVRRLTNSRSGDYWPAWRP